jgi:excisionase family DNA binding protein
MDTISVKSLEGIMTNWITVKEAAERMGITDSYVRQLARKQVIKGQHFGRDWQIDPESIDGFEKDTRGYPRGKPRPKK